MNADNKEFLEINGIDPEVIGQKLDCIVKRQSEINRIVYDYGFQEKRGMQKVSISDIVGYFMDSRQIKRDIFRSMDNFFDSQGDGYHSRSVDMLEYNEDNILEGLRPSFKYEPICVCETGEGQYTIDINGLHRYTLLRILYLKEVYEAKGDEEQIQKIREKYTIPVRVTGINLENTYCKYILDTMPQENEEDKIVYMGTDYGENYTSTGNVVIKYASGEEKIITTEEFIELARQRLSSQKEYPPSFEYNMKKYKSFGKFMKEHFSDIIQLPEMEERNGQEHD